MKPSPALALIALLPLGCAGATPAASDPAGATSQRPAAVTVVDLTPAPAPAPSAAPSAAPSDPAAGSADLQRLGAIGGDDSHALKEGEPLPPDLLDGAAMAPINDPFGTGGIVGGVMGSGGVGFGSIGTLGAGVVGGTGQGVGIGTGRLGGRPTGALPQLQAGPIVSNVGLPKEIIQRIVRRNIARLRFCYDKGLVNNPKLQGSVVVRFTVDKTGAVSSAAVAKDTTLPDATVSACVSSAFSSFVFPQPDGGGVVNVVYPIAFAPDENTSAPAKPAPAKPPPPPPPAPVPVKKP